jgi:hypothetical protein
MAIALRAEIGLKRKSRMTQRIGAGLNAQAIPA